MKKNVFTLAILAMVVSVSYAQNDLSGINNQNVISNKSITTSKKKDYKGSHYEVDTFESGLILLNEKPVLVNAGIRYNVLRDEIEVKENTRQADASAKVLVKSPNIHIKSKGKDYVYVSQKEGLNKPGYFILLHEGDTYSLYKKLTKEFIPGYESINSYTQDVASLYKNHEYYYLSKDGIFSELENSKKKKIEAFGLDKKYMKNLIKENKLNLNKEKDLTTLVKLVNKL